MVSQRQGITNAFADKKYPLCSNKIVPHGYDPPVTGDNILNIRR